MLKVKNNKKLCLALYGEPIAKAKERYLL